MNRWKQRLFFVIVVCAAIWGMLYQILIDPAHVMHELGGDGMKNYYAYLYHALYGSGWWFNGMNYPYGEHIMFTDGQPVLTLLLSYLGNWVHWSAEKLNVVINLVMAANLFVAITFTYKLLCRFRVQYTWATLFAIFIVMLSNQNFMIFGGYGLAYSCVVPVTFYWFVRYRDTNKLKYAVYLFLFACLVMFLHPYQLALILVWTGLYAAGYLLFVRSRVKAKMRHVLPMLVAVAGAVIVFKIFLVVTDPVIDRPVYPHGLLSYGTTGEHIFTYYYSPYWQFLQKSGVIQHLPENIKGYAYTGIVAIAVLGFFLLFILYRFLLKRDKQVRVYLPDSFSGVWLFIGFGALLFSMGVPFVWGLEVLFDYVASFRQFRALNLFGLIFYYTATVFVVAMLSQLFRNRKEQQKRLAVLWLIIPAIIWGYESYGVVRKFHVKGYGLRYNYEMFMSKHETSWPQLLSEHGYGSSDFQAILHVPYTHVGSEKIWLARSAWGCCLAMKAGYQLHLPLVDANMSRSSWSQTFKQVKIDGGPFTDKPLLYDVKDNRPYLLMRFAYEALNPDEQYIISQADSIGSTSDMIAYALYPDKLKKSDKQARAGIFAIAAQTSGKDTNLTGGDIYYKHYDTLTNDKVFWGTGAALPVIGKDTSLEVIDVTRWKKDVLYECSGWFLVNDFDYRSPDIIIDVFDKDGNCLLKNRAACNQATDVQDMWFRASNYFVLPATATTIVLSLKEHHKNVYYGFDELLIRQATDTVISVSNGRVMVNNHLLKPE